MKKLFVLLAVMVAMGSPLILSAQTGQAVPRRTSATSDPVLQPGDVVKIGVWQQPAWSGEFPIASDGTIQHPLYRAIRVAGVPLSVAEGRMRTFLRRYEETPTFSMQVLFPVAVGGAVNDPKLLTLSPEVSIAQAVALAGGATEQAQLDRVRLVRGGVETTLNLASPDTETLAMTVRSGDQIVLPRRRNIFQEYVLPGTQIAGTLVTIINLIMIAGS